tara:strand:+ start:133 stop:1281 length:1149 start_codon:yes stop_codon:yes gene_type:complete
MLKTTAINAKLFLIFLLLFCVPLIFPQIESKFILTQFGIIVPLYLISNLFTSEYFVKFQIVIFLLLSLLMIIGMPGSISGWMAMVCFGYLFGIRTARSQIKTLKELAPFIICSIIMCSWVLKDNLNNSFSQELLSDYFQKSSINTVPILMVCSFNLYCSVLFYCISKNNKKNDLGLKKEFIILTILVITAILSVVSFDFRSGFIILISTILIILKFINLKFSKFLFALLFFLLSYLLYSSDLFIFLIDFLTQGGGDLALVSNELATGALRFDRIIRFWEISWFSKFNFTLWSNYFSVSGMSDFTAALFPLSLIFFLFPINGLTSLFKRVYKKNFLVLLIILSCLTSSFVISVLQPDFFSFFSFYAIYTMIYYGEKKSQKITN